MNNIRTKIALTTLITTLTMTGCSLISGVGDTARKDNSGASLTFEYQTPEDDAATEESTASADDAATEEVTTNPALEEQAAGTTTSVPMGLLSSAEDLNLTATDNKGKNYTFTYNGQEYTAVHTADHWKIKNSYDINDEADMLIICQALIDLHPIHGKDMVSYRTADDMVYEWAIHNLGYALVSDDDSMKSHLRDIDFDPQDQGCNLKEIYYNHTGKELDLGNILGG